MEKDLMERFGAESSTLYDKAHERFGPISTEEAHKLFVKLSVKYPEFSYNDSPKNSEQSAFTYVDKDGRYSWNKRRPALLISSTSWTEDEDFGILLSALLEYDQAGSHEENLNLPNLVCVITGKGPQKAYYCSRICSQVGMCIIK